MAAVLADIDLKRHEKVVANIDLPRVPAGTPGKVLMVTGVSWIRVRVLFANGVEIGLLDGRHLVRPKDFVPLDQRVEEEPEEAPSTNGAEPESSDDAAAADNPLGVPAHLLERSRKARERLGASS